MERYFVFEYLTASGIGLDPGDSLHPMYREGRAMRDAVVEDLRKIPGAEVEFLDHVMKDVETAVEAVAATCEYSLVIAPETNGLLEKFSQLVEASGSCLLGSSCDAIRLTTDKLALATYWRERGIPTPATTDRAPTACEAFPVIWKPRDGAGSTATFLLRDRFDVARAEALAAAENAGPMILQEYVPGRAVSVAFLCGPAGYFPLIPTFQLLTDDGRFNYLGGELPIPCDLSDRAIQTATCAIKTITGLKGYIGIDLILGRSEDFAIEINPRITTSYVGLRSLYEGNLIATLLHIFAGNAPSIPRWKPGTIQFTSHGAISPAS